MEKLKKLIQQELGSKGLKEKVEFLNNIRYEIHLLSPFKNEPMDFIETGLGRNQRLSIRE